MGRCTTLVAILFVSIVLGEDDAWGVDATAASARAGALPAATRSERAEAAYDRSIALYSAGDKPGALTAMQESYRLLDHPDLLYNIARLERELGRCRDALGHYRVYVGLVPAGEYRAPALEAEHDLSRTCGDPPAPPYWTTRRIIAWSAIGAGAVASAGALYFALSARAENDDLQRSIHAHIDGGSPYEPADRDEDLAAHRAQTLAVMSGVAAGSLVTGGVLLLVLPARQEAKVSPDVAVAAHPGGAFIRYSQRF